MRRLGKVLHLSKSRNLIVRLEQSSSSSSKKNSSILPPRVGTEVYSQKIQKVGTVNNILGPVKAPYASLTPMGDFQSVIGKTVYLLVERGPETQ